MFNDAKIVILSYITYIFFKKIFVSEILFPIFWHFGKK